MIEEYSDFLKVIKLCAGLNNNLMGGCCRSVFNLDNTANVQALWINPVLTCCHHIIVNFHFLETGNVLHLDQSDTEIRCVRERSRARLIVQAVPRLRRRRLSRQ